MPSEPIRTDREAITRAQAAGWRIEHITGVGMRLVQPHTVPQHLAAEAAVVAAYLRHRLPAVLALLNTATQETPA